MLQGRAWSGWVAVVALLASGARAQGSASTSSLASSSSVSATSTIAAVPTSTTTAAPYLASCPAELELQISSCLDMVAKDGAILPCNGDDWWCNCNNWQGVLSCYQPCPDMQDQLDIAWNQQNCQGQHGFANDFGGNSTGTYVGSNLTTTGSNGVTRSYYSQMPVAATSTSSSAWTWSPSATGSSAQRSSSASSQSYAIPAGLLACSLVIATASIILVL